MVAAADRVDVATVEAISRRIMGGLTGSLMIFVDCLSTISSNGASLRKCPRPFIIASHL